ARVGPTVLHSAVEHSSVLHAARWADAPTVSVPVGRSGLVDVDRLVEEARRSPAPVAVAALQSANHEVGTLQPVTAVAEALGDVPLFVDACASAGRLPLPQGWAAAAASAHKW